MIRAAIVGLGRWGRALVASVQGKSDDITFVAAHTRTADDSMKLPPRSDPATRAQSPNTRAYTLH